MMLNVDEMNLYELKDIVKMLLQNASFDCDRITALQERVIQLELAVYRDHDIIK